MKLTKKWTVVPYVETVADKLKEVLTNKETCPGTNLMEYNQVVTDPKMLIPKYVPPAKNNPFSNNTTNNPDQIFQILKAENVKQEVSSFNPPTIEPNQIVQVLKQEKKNKLSTPQAHEFKESSVDPNKFFFDAP